jgi:hypothetical protein
MNLGSGRKQFAEPLAKSLAPRKKQGIGKEVSSNVQRVSCDESLQIVTIVGVVLLSYHPLGRGWLLLVSSSGKLLRCARGPASDREDHQE